jgi:RNA-directed DNA polymerase
MTEFGLELHSDKTRLIEFGRRAAAARAARGEGKPETFNFLGFTHICTRSRRGGFLLARHTRRDRTMAKLLEITEDLRRRWHQDIAEQGRWLGTIVRGYFAYHAVPTNVHALSAFRHHVVDLWRRALRRRSQKDRSSWTDWLTAGCPSPGYRTPGALRASASNTQGGSRMREFRSYGSVRGARSNARPYRD